MKKFFLNSKVQKTLVLIIVLAIFTLQSGIVWAADNAKSQPSDEQLTKINKAHQHVDEMKAKLLSESKTEMDTYLAYKLANDFHNKVNDLYTTGSDSPIDVKSIAKKESEKSPLSDQIKGGSSSGNGALNGSNSQNTSPVSGLSSNQQGISNILNGLGGNGSGNGASQPGNNNASLPNFGGSSSGNGSSNGGSASPVALPGSSSNNSSSSNGIGGFLSNTLGSLFGGSGSGSSGLSGGIGSMFSNLFGSNGTIGKIMNKINSLMQNGITGNGTFSTTLFLFNTIWNFLYNFLMKKIAAFISNIATKIKNKIASLINKIPSTLPLIGGFLSGLKTKALNAVNGIVNKLKLKALSFVRGLLLKVKGMIKKKLGI